MYKYLLTGLLFCVCSVSPLTAAQRTREAADNWVLVLDGKKAGVRVEHSDSLGALADTITVEAWLKASSFQREDMLISTILRKNIEAGKENFLLRLRTVRSKPQVEFSLGADIGMLAAPYDFAENTWYHLAGTYDGQRMVIYVNGVAIKRADVAGRLSIDRSSLLIGKGDPEFSGGEYFHGALDDVRIWNVARTEKELLAGMNGTLSGREAGLVAWWSFDDGTARDLSPKGNDGKLDGDARIEPSPRPSAASQNQRATQPLAQSQLSTEKRLEVLEALWKNLSEIYPALEYKGIRTRDWIAPAEKRIRNEKSDDEFYGILMELMAGLNDTHTRIISYPGQPIRQSPPVTLNQVAGKVTVIRAAAETQLAPGDVIRSIEDRPADECLAAEMKRIGHSTDRGRIREACEQLLAGAPGTSVTVTAEGVDGKPRRITLQRESHAEFSQEPTILPRMLDGTVGYVRISRWTTAREGGGLVERFDDALEKLKAAGGLVIDVRGNPGGDDRVADLVSGRLTDKAVLSSIDFWRKAGGDTFQKTNSWITPRGPWTYKGRVAVLIDEATASASEHFVAGIEAMGNILLVGAPTCGAGGGPTMISLPDGTRVCISRALGVRANGVVFEGRGIPPHIFYSPTLADLRAGRDGALELAREWINSGKELPRRTEPLETRRDLGER